MPDSDELRNSETDTWGDFVLTVVLGVLSQILDAITYIPCLLWFRPWTKRARSNRCKAKSVSGKPEGPWRAVEALNSLSTMHFFPMCSTVDDLFLHAVEHHASAPCLGTRERLREEIEEDAFTNEKKVTFVMGEYQWLTYRQVLERVNAFGRGLLALGQEPLSELVIIAETRAEWMIVAQACFKFNFPLVTLCDSLGQQAVIHAIKETEATHIVTSYDRLQRFDSALDKMPKVTHLLVMGALGHHIAVKKKPPAVILLTMENVEEKGAKPDNRQAHGTKPTTEDVALIIYTSGNSVSPKAVEITHASLMCGLSGLQERILDCRKTQDDIYMSYLPLAHILEMTIEIFVLANGLRLGYSSPLTILDESVRIQSGSQGDITLLKPTILLTVPAVLNQMCKKVWEKVNAGGGVSKAVFHFAYHYKLKHITNGYDTPILNKFIFAKVAQLFGGRLRMVVCGGAPLPGDTQRFMRICFCSLVMQGYSLTETSGVATISEATDLSVGHVGQPLVCNELLFRDWPKGDYTMRDLPLPRGEVLVGGGNVAQGYYKLEELSDDFIVINGTRYFCTGDIGKMEPTGVLTLIDRKKDVVKLQNGRYVSLGKVEEVIKVCPLVHQACVVPNRKESYCVCLIVPNEKQIRIMLKLMGCGVLPDDLSMLCNMPFVQDLIVNTIKGTAARHKLGFYETPKKFALCLDPWTLANHLLTSNNTIKRDQIARCFADEINAMYFSGSQSQSVSFSSGVRP